MPLILSGNVGSATAATGYNVDNSLRFSPASSTGLELDLGTPTNAKKYTISFWVKRDVSSASGDVIAGGTNGSNETFIRMNSNGQFQLKADHGSATSWAVIPNALGRDSSAWYNYILAVDTSQGTASNRVKIYLNGELQSLSTANYPDQNDAVGFLNNDNVIHIGKRNYDDAVYFGGYLCEFVFLDGQTLDATSFGEFDADSGIWKPIDVSGLTFGNNGFYLEFKQSGTSQNSSGLGADTSGNDNHFAVENLTALDQSIDTCTNNFATLNPLIITAYGSELSNGNLDCVQSDVRGRFHNVTTIGASSGKYYAEIKLTGGSDHVMGVATDASFTNASTLLTSGFNYLGQSGTLSYSYYVADGTVYVNGTNSAHGATLTTNDILGIYLDLDNHKLYFSKNGALQSSTGIDIPTGYDYFFGVGDLGTGDSGEVSCNFGSPSYAISSSNTDDNGYGNFEYSPNITGDSVAKKFYSLNTKNLAEYG
jgi:hypothetical protein